MFATNSRKISLLTIAQLLQSHVQFVIRAGCLSRWTHGLLQARGNLYKILRRRRNGRTDRALRFHKTQVVRGVAGTGKVDCGTRMNANKKVRSKTLGWSLLVDFWRFFTSTVSSLLFRRKHGVEWFFVCPSYARLCLLCCNCKLRSPVLCNTTMPPTEVSSSILCVLWWCRFYILYFLLPLELEYS